MYICKILILIELLEKHEDYIYTLLSSIERQKSIFTFFFQFFAY